MTDWNCDRWERLEEIAQSVAPDETLSLLVGDRIIEARVTGTRPAPKDYHTWADGYQVHALTPE
jgi:hypothetical protein